MTIAVVALPLWGVTGIPTPRSYRAHGPNQAECRRPTVTPAAALADRDRMIVKLRAHGWKQADVAARPLLIRPRSHPTDDGESDFLPRHA
jgi:hypothetical protein